MTEPLWLRLARREIGVAERAGQSADPRILAYYRETGHAGIRHDEVAWCAAFAGACLERAGIRSTRSLRARSYLAWGTPLAVPRSGAVVVLSRGRDPKAGHVGFCIGKSDDRLLLLGGNQSNAVGIAAFPRSRVLGIRWPAAGTTVRVEPGFEAALAHVLRFEGGWSKHEADPGGATNHGITLSTYAGHLGVRLSAQNARRLETALRALTPEDAAEIYLRRYWRAGACDRLPPALAFLHFDAAVLHGRRRAAQLLQQALGVARDGDVGSQTLAAARSADAIATVRQIAKLRRGLCRALPAFSTFGRGWLRRIGATETAALKLTGASVPHTGSNKETTTMTTKPKWWGQSTTLWGAAITLLTAVLPALGPLFGLDISKEMAAEIGEVLTRLLQGGGGLLGTFLTVYGRLRAVRPLVRRRLQFRV